MQQWACFITTRKRKITISLTSNFIQNSEWVEKGPLPKKVIMQKKSEQGNGHNFFQLQGNGL